MACNNEETAGHFHNSADKMEKMTGTLAEQSTYDPDRLLDTLIEKLSLKNDAALSRALEVPPPALTRPHGTADLFNRVIETQRCNRHPGVIPSALLAAPFGASFPATVPTVVVPFAAAFPAAAAFPGAAFLPCLLAAALHASTARWLRPRTVRRARFLA